MSDGAKGGVQAGDHTGAQAAVPLSQQKGLQGCKGEGVQDRASSGLQAGANPGGNKSLQEFSSRGNQ